MRLEEHVTPEPLRRLHDPQRVAIGRAHNEPISVHDLDRVDHRQDGHDCRGLGGHRRRHPLEDLARREGSRCIVDEDHLAFGRQPPGRGQHAVAPLGTPRDHLDRYAVLPP